MTGGTHQTGQPLLALVDHGAGNMVSITHGLQRVGAEVILATTPEEIEKADGVVLPGVGTTGAVMAGIRALGVESILQRGDKPLLGICVGMQVLFEGSDEDDAVCLGLIEGRNRRLEDTPRLPHIGWNEITPTGPAQLLDNIPDDALFYFVHSYAPEPGDPSAVTATAEYGVVFPAVVRSGRVWGTQFHPERSHHNGHLILSNFVSSVVADRAA